VSLQQITNKISSKNLFLLDSLGALLSAILLGVVLVSFENEFGMPQKVLNMLSYTAIILSIYSFICFLKNSVNWRPYLKIIAIVNLLYCCLTMGLLIYFYQKLTVLGVFYFVIETLVITILAIIELKKANATF
jgi:hypothetical protein